MMMTISGMMIRKRARKAPERTGIVNEAESGKREKDVSKSRKEASV